MGNYGTMPSFNLMLLGKAVEVGLASIFLHSKDSIDTDALFRKATGNACLFMCLLPLREEALTVQSRETLRLVTSLEDQTLP